jgi:hypothetical protein
MLVRSEAMCVHPRLKLMFKSDHDINFLRMKSHE